MVSNQDQPANPSDLYIHRNEGVYLKSWKQPKNGFLNHLVSNWQGIELPVNESAALVWKCCQEPIRLADLIQALTSHFPESSSLESEILDMITQFQSVDLLTLSQELQREFRRPPDYPPVRQDIFTATDSHSDCGIIITVHNHVARFGLPCLKSVLEHSGNARIYLYDNESSDPDIRDLKNFANAQPNVEFIRIDDQTAFGGLTGTWNDGIDRARREGLKKVILLNHDVVVGHTWGNFIHSIDSDYCIYGPLTDNPGGGGGGKGIQHAESASYCGLLKARELLGFCMGFTLDRPHLKLFDEWRFFNPERPFGGNEFGIQKRMKKRSNKTRFYVVTDSWVLHHLNMGWKDNPKYLDPHNLAPKSATPLVPRFSRANYVTTFNERNIFHMLHKEILPLGMADVAEFRASNLYIVENKIDRHELGQIWRMFVLSNIFHEVDYISANEADHIVNSTHLETNPSYQHYEFIDYPPKKEYVRLSESIKKNAGIMTVDRGYVLLNQRPKGNRYLMESDTGLPLEEYLRRALDERGIPFKYCDFSAMTPAEQAIICGGAKIFIAAHGAGFSNTIFTPQRCHVLEYNFRKHWNCDPVCKPHFHGVLADHEQCEGELKWWPSFHKADFHNLCRLLGRPYTELEAIRYDGFFSRNPISRRYLFVDGTRLLAEIEKQTSS